jgi:twitching motility two-component system response regulator PilH
MVLVIESSAALRQMVTVELENSGFAAITANNGPDALKFLETFNVDMIIANLSMTDMSGVELASLIKRKPGYLSVPIIMMTNVPKKHLRIDKTNGHIDEWIEKPVRPEQIRETMQKYFETPGRKHYS